MLRTRGHSIVDIRCSGTVESPALLSTETVASSMTRNRSITRPGIDFIRFFYFGFDSFHSAILYYFFVEFFLTKFNFSFREVAIGCRLFLSLGSTLRRPSASFMSFVITVLFPPRLARVRDRFPAISFFCVSGYQGPTLGAFYCRRTNPRHIHMI